jgi:hypothetical protein
MESARRGQLARYEADAHLKMESMVARLGLGGEAALEIENTEEAAAAASSAR